MTRRRILFESNNAAIEARGKFWELVSTSERKVIIHAALRQGGLFWMLKYIPQRFSNYAYSLGYRVTDQWKKFKRRVLNGAAIPYIGVTPPGGGGAGVVKRGKRIFKAQNPNGEKMAVAVERGSNVKVKGTSAGGDIHIAIPYGHPLNAVTAAALRKLPDNEIQAVAAVVARELDELIQSAHAVPRSRKGKLTIRGASMSIKSRVGGLAVQAPRSKKT